MQFFCITYLFCLIWANTVDDRNNLNCDDESERLFITGHFILFYLLTKSGTEKILWWNRFQWNS